MVVLEIYECPCGGMEIGAKGKPGFMKCLYCGRKKDAKGIRFHKTELPSIKRPNK